MTTQKGVNLMDKNSSTEQAEKSTNKSTCALLNSNLCPHPKKCDGINRLCDIWKTHSGR